MMCRSEELFIIPFSMLNKNLSKNLKLKKGNFFDYGLQLNDNNNYQINKNFCSMPFPLAIGYALSIAVAGKVKSVKVAGFDGYSKSDTDQDETEEIFKYFSSRYFKNKIISLTKTKFKTLKHKTYG